MSRCKFNNENWNELLYAIRQQKCILMAGPDLAVEQRNGHAELLMKILAKRFSEKLSDKIRERINSSNLTEAAQSYWLEKNRSINAVRIFAEQFYAERKHLSSELHRHLAELPFYFMITSTPDKMLENALREKGKIPKIERYNYNGKGKKCDIIDMGTLENPLIYYLFGTTDEPDSLVLTEDNLLDFLVAVISENPPLPVNIRSEISSKDKSFLFLGFGFNH